MSRSLAESVTVFGWDTTAFRTDHHVIISEYLLVFSVLLTISLLLQHYWTKRWKCTSMPEAGVTILLGVAVSFLIYSTGGYETLHQGSTADTSVGARVLELANTDDKDSGISSGLRILSFSPTVFFFGFLPPIIYNSGYHLKRTSFYGNIGAIMMLAVGGACISTMTIATGMYYAPRLFNGPQSDVQASNMSQNVSTYATSSSQSLRGQATLDFSHLAFEAEEMKWIPEPRSGSHVEFVAAPAKRYLRTGDNFMSPQHTATPISNTASVASTGTNSGSEEQQIRVPEFTFMECVAYGALISSTDPVSTLAIFTEHRVDPALFYLVFGESVLNDAIAITIFKVASSFIGSGDMEVIDIATFAGKFCIIFLSSCLIGYGLGIFSAYLFKVLVHLHSDDLAILGVFCSTVYIPFLLAETLQLSGIVTILFTGIASRRYTSKNVAPSLRLTISKLFHLLAYASDTSCFLLLGLITFNLPFSSYNWVLIGWLCVLCVASRCLFVYPLLTLCNLYRRYSRESAGTDSSGLPSTDPGGVEMVNYHQHTATYNTNNCGDNPYCRNPSLPSSSSEYPDPNIELLEPTSSDLKDYYNTLSQSNGLSGENSRSDSPEANQGAESSLHLLIPPEHDHITAPIMYIPSRPPPPAMGVIPSNIKHMVAFSGLRGGVAFAFAMMFSDVYGNRSVLLTTTISIIMLTIFVQGGLTVHLLRYLGIKTGVTNRPNRTSSKTPQGGRSPNHSEGVPAHGMMTDFEQKYIYPLVLVRHAGCSAENVSSSAINSESGEVSTEPEAPLIHPEGGDIYSPYYRSASGLGGNDISLSSAVTLPPRVDTDPEPPDPRLLSPLHPLHQAQLSVQQSQQGRSIHPLAQLPSLRRRDRGMFEEEPCSSGGGSYHDPEDDAESLLLRNPVSESVDNKISLFFSPQRATKYNGLA